MAESTPMGGLGNEPMRPGDAELFYMKRRGKEYDVP